MPSDAVASTPWPNFGRGRTPHSLHTASYAKFPKHTTTRTFVSNSRSRTRYVRHESRSSIEGLLSGGAQRTADDTHAPVSRSPSSRPTDSSCVASPARCIARYNQSPLRSPVNIRPVLFAPCAAGARPITQTAADGSPKPGTPLPQYSSSRNDARFSSATSSRHCTNRGQVRHAEISAHTLSRESTCSTVG